jgi:hypothetical protein
VTLVPLPDHPNYVGKRWYQCDACRRYVDESKVVDECPHCAGEVQPASAGLPEGTRYATLQEPVVRVRLSRVVADDPTWKDSDPTILGHVEVPLATFLCWALKNRQGREVPHKTVAAMLSALLSQELGIRVVFDGKQVEGRARYFSEKLVAALPTDWPQHPEWNILGITEGPAAIEVVQPRTAKEQGVWKQRAIVGDPNDGEPHQRGKDEGMTYTSPRKVESTPVNVRVVIPGLEQEYDGPDLRGRDHKFTPEES